MKKNIVLSFNLDKEYDREVYEILQKEAEIGLSRNGLIKRILYFALVKKNEKQARDGVEKDKNPVYKNFLDDLDK